MELLPECAWLPWREQAQKRSLGHRFGVEKRIPSEEALREAEKYNSEDRKLNISLSGT